MATGNVSATANITGGNLITGGAVSATGNVLAGNLNLTGNIVDTGEIAILTGSNGNIRLIPNGTGQTNVTGLLSATGNIVGNFFVGNGSALTGISVGPGGSNTFVQFNDAGSLGGTAGLTFDKTSNTLVSTGNVSATGNVIAGNVQTGNLSLSGNVLTAINSTSNITTTANITGGNIITAGTPGTGNISGANVISTVTLSASGNITGSNIITAGTPGTGNISGANVISTVTLSATGNITGNYFIGNGSQLTGISSGNTSPGGANTDVQFNDAGVLGGTGGLTFNKITNSLVSTGSIITGDLDAVNLVISTIYSDDSSFVNIADGLNVTGSLLVDGKKAVNGPAFSAYANATLQTITSGSQQKVLFQTEEFDTDGCFASSTFTPNVEGYYQLNAQVRLEGASGTGEMMIVIWKNGAEYKRGTNQQGVQIATNFWAMQVSSLVYANGTSDYFEIYVQQTSGSSVTVTAVNAVNITWFNGVMVRGA